MPDVPRHKVFISYYHADDQEYKDRLIQALDTKFVDKSVSQGDIHDEGLPLEEIRRKIRDNHIADATVTIVLIGRCTWQRKHVDWEISASIIDRSNNQRCGMLGLLLPTHPDYHKRPSDRNPRLIPPRCGTSAANDPSPSFTTGQEWMSRKFCRNPYSIPGEQFSLADDGLRLFETNRSGDCSRGWQKLD